MDVSLKNELLDCFKNDNVDELKILKQKHPDILHTAINIQAGRKEYSIHTAAKTGASKCLKYILDEGVNPDFCENILSDYPLQMAAQNGHYDAMMVLLEKGANPNVQNLYNRTPIIYVAAAEIDENLKIKMAKKLIEYGADPCALGMFYTGEFGLKPMYLNSGKFMSAFEISKYNKENKLSRLLYVESRKWKKKHSFKSQTLRALNGLGHLISNPKKLYSKLSKINGGMIDKTR